MIGKKIDISGVLIKSAYDVELNRLKEFYDIMDPSGANALIWKWLNRSSFYNNEIPIVAVYEDKIVGHAGMMPFKIVINNHEYRASWFINLYILPEFQRQRIGIRLTEKWMEYSDLYVTFCNEKSIGVFKKYGWIESFDTYYHRFFLMPFNVPMFKGSTPLFLRKCLNKLSSPILNMIYKKNMSSIDNLHVVDLNLNTLDRFVSSLRMKSNTVMAVRDFEYISWRILNSPHKYKYRIVYLDGDNDVSFIIKMCDKYHPRIDLLWISNPFVFSAIRHLMAAVAVWGMSKTYSYIRYVTTDRELSVYLNKSFKSWVQNLRFAYYSKNAELMQRIATHGNWYWEMIDSDFEEF